MRYITIRALSKKCKCQDKFQIKHSITTKCRFDTKVPASLWIHRDGFRWQVSKIGQQLQADSLRPKSLLFQIPIILDLAITN